ncbi:MAG: DNA gyrase inhibitor YacG [Zoogloeaceae bacterium]|nr:DNA gyrase inhibitor YacG [Zoogloeaceae bacterium]
MAEGEKGLLVKCPCCGAAVRWQPAAEFRPFCSRRCRDQDLLAWATEAYRVVGEPNESEGSPDTT